MIRRGEGSLAVPACLESAYAAIASGKAFVGVYPIADGPGVEVVWGDAAAAELPLDVMAVYCAPTTAPDVRAVFLFSALETIAKSCRHGSDS